MLKLQYILIFIFNYELLNIEYDGGNMYNGIEAFIHPAAIFLIHDYARVGTGEILVTALTEDDIISGTKPLTRKISGVIK